ncbi:MAG: insulinase family protein [Lachnospiraceae bacterium]|nr:insulinase family protein [Lachnospiraceae bacterium]MEE1248894.1 insulinase family protein [Lachnospiraceae bacterium]
MKYLTLGNGLSVLFHQMQNTHSVTVGLYVKAGSGYETSEYNGITHLLEHLHFRKLGKYSQEELYYKMESMGSTLRAATYCNFLKFTMKVVPEKIEECIDIFQELIVTKEWMDEEIKQEKQVVINQILEKGNYITIDREVRKNIFKDHGLANEIMGNIQTVNNIRKTDLEKYKKEMFL